jgi:hypothetical protein
MNILKKSTKQGVKIGERRKEAETALKMLNKGYTAQDILDITGISQKRLNQIAGYEVYNRLFINYPCVLYT